MKTNCLNTKQREAGGYCMVRMALFFSLLLPLSCFLSSCWDEPAVPDDLTEQPAALTIQIRLPGLTLPGTRSGMEENEIAALDMLVFEKQADGSEIYAYRTPAHALSTGNGESQVRNFTVYLHPGEGTETYRLVFLANLRDEIEAAALVKGETKEETLKKITFGNSVPWDTVTPRYLPMWGESRETHPVTTELSGSDIGTIYLLRAVARLDVGVNMSGEDDQPQGLSQGSFLIREVKLHQVAGKGTAAPQSGAFNPAGGLSGEGIVTAPTPTGTLTTLSYQKTTPDPGFFKEIYLAETAGGPIGSPTTYTLLVHAFYTPPEASPVTTSTWYKINLYDERNQDPTSNVWPILRNHRYRVNITAVDQQGYTSEAEALTAEANNLTVQLSVFEEDGGINYVTYNGQYYLGVSRSQLTVPAHRDAGGVITVGPAVRESLRIKSNFHSSWNCSFTDSPERSGGNPIDWVVYESGNWSGPEQSDKVEFRILPNITGRDRTGYIHLSAGLLHLAVEVKQAKARPADLPNCYILPPGGGDYPSGNLYIPVLKAYLVWADEVMGGQQHLLSGELEAEVIWQDTDELLTISIPPAASGPETVIRVFANKDNRMGNALVGIKIGGILRYSWHIWVTDYNPDTHYKGTTYVYNNGYQNYRFMDRNLGALTTTPGELTTHGFLYQWGRKDPFPGPNDLVYESAAVRKSTHTPLYVGSSGTTSTDAITITDVTDLYNLPNTLTHPMTYYTAQNRGNDWFSSADDIHNEYLWSDENAGKGIFDPCPEGWRVPDWTRDAERNPLHSPWEGWTLSNSPWDPAGYGNTGLDGGFYPAVGMRDPEIGLFDLVGRIGAYWSATFSYYPQGWDMHVLSMSNNSIVTDAQGGRPAIGLSIRCVKE
ncbi:MAG: hypothetical protein LUG98_02705 [Tannerellaceae bacterium]|nr:hypothetical protein [Tannerellaceae bacterium]